MDANHLSGPAFAVVHDVAATWEDYHLVRRLIADNETPGLILHAAGPTDDGFRTIDVWASEHDWQLHRGRLDRVFERLHVPPVMRDFRVGHLIPSPQPPETTVSPDPRSNSHDEGT